MFDKELLMRMFDMKLQDEVRRSETRKSTKITDIIEHMSIPSTLCH